MSMGQGREVFVTVRVEESDYFRRSGCDVHTSANISISQALLGGIIRVKGLYEELNLRIPAGTSSHSEMRLSGRGIKKLESFNSFGDHIVHIIIKLPTHLTAEQKDLVREYAYLESNTPGTVTGVDRGVGSWTRRHKQGEGSSSSSSGSSGKSSEENTK